jgi:hypothetical protein
MICFRTTVVRHEATNKNGTFFTACPGYRYVLSACSFDQPGSDFDPGGPIYTRLPFFAALEEAASTVERVINTSGV